MQGTATRLRLIRLIALFNLGGVALWAQEPIETERDSFTEPNAETVIGSSLRPSVFSRARLRRPRPSVPLLGKKVLKSGAETGVTEGIVRRIQGDEVLIEPLWPDHTICGPGDSGAVWIDADATSPVVLNCEERNPGGKAFGRSVMNVLEQLRLQIVID